METDSLFCKTRKLLSRLTSISQSSHTQRGDSESPISLSQSAQNYQSGSWLFRSRWLLAQVGHILRKKVANQNLPGTKHLVKLPFVRSSFTSYNVSAVFDDLPSCSGNEHAELQVETTRPRGGWHWISRQTLIFKIVVLALTYNSHDINLYLRKCTLPRL